MVIEIDGHSHAESERREYDAARTQWLEQQGMRVVRFTNRDVDTNIEGVLEAIAEMSGVLPSGC